MIAVGIVGIGAVLELLEIGEAVVVGVQGSIVYEGVQTVGNFEAVWHAVAIGVAFQRKNLQDDGRECEGFCKRGIRAGANPDNCTGGVGRNSDRGGGVGCTGGDLHWRIRIKLKPEEGRT